MRIDYSRSAFKVLERMEKPLRMRIVKAIEGLTLTPPQGDIKPMQGKPEGRYRLRVGGYRVIYRYDMDGLVTVLFVIDVGARGDVYK